MQGAIQVLCFTFFNGIALTDTVDRQLYIQNKKLSCRKETVRLLRGTVLAKYNWNTIFCKHFRFICDVIGLQSYRIL